MTRKFAQLQEQFLAGSGAKIGDTVITLKSFKQIDGTDITDMTIFGDFAYATIEPGKSTREEQITFSGVSVNGDGTVSLTGVASILMVDPYTSTPGLLKGHAGSVKFVISNTSGFYKDTMTPDGNYEITGENTYSQSLPRWTKDTDIDGTLDVPTLPGEFIFKEYFEAQLALATDDKVGLTGDETIEGIKTFDVSPIVPTPVNPTDASNKAYIDGIAIAGAPDASEVLKGISRFATTEQALAGTDTEGGDPLMVRPSDVASIADASSMDWSVSKTYAEDAMVTYERALYASNVNSNIANLPDAIKPNIEDLISGEKYFGDILTSSITYFRFGDSGMKLYLGYQSNTLYQYSLSVAYDVNTAVYDTKTLSTSPKDTAMTCLQFKPDGLELYLSGYSNDKIYKYTMSVAWDISTATFTNEFSVSSEETTPRGFVFNDTGLKMFLVGDAGNDVNEYALGVAWDITTLSATTAFSISSQAQDAYSILFNTDGTVMYIQDSSDQRIYGYDLSTGWDLTTASFNGSSWDYDNFNMSVYDMDWNADGTQIYLNNVSTKKILTFDLDTAYDLVGIKKTGKVFDLSTQDTGTRGARFSDDGLKMFMIGSTNNKIYEYDLSVAWDVTTAVYSTELALSGTTGTNTFGFTFANSGLKIYVVGYTNDTVYQYDLSVAYDLSTAVYSTNSFGYIAQDSTVYDVLMNDDGLKMFILGRTNGKVYEYDLSVAWDVSTSVYSQDFAVGTTVVDGMEWNNDGTKLYVISGGSSYFLYEFTLGTAYDISTMFYSARAYVYNTDTQLQGVTIKADGTSIFLIGNQTKDIIEFSMAVAFDIQNPISEINKIYVNSQDSVPKGVWFKPDGLKMFMCGSTTSDVFAYDLGKAWDLNTAVYNGEFISNTSTPSGTSRITMSTDGSKMFLMSTSSVMYQWTLSTPWDVSTATYDTVQKTLSSPSEVSGSVQGVHFTPDGMRILFCDTGSDKIWQWNLEQPWDISTTWFPVIGSISVSGQAPGTEDIIFSEDGLQMWLLYGGNVYEYKLFNPFDIVSLVYTGKVADLSEILSTSSYQSFYLSPNGKYMFAVNTLDYIERAYFEEPIFGNWTKLTQ